MTDANRVSYRRTRTDQTYRDTARAVTLEGQLIDDQGNPIPDSRDWTRHPQQKRARRLQPIGLDDAIDDLDIPMRRQRGDGGTNVTVNNAGQFYRPWREELLISGWKTFGNLLAWPFRLVGRFVEHIVTMAAGVLKIMLLAVVLPSLLFAGYSFYQSHRDRPATETAAEIGSSGVHIVGAAVSGIWHGIFGGGEPAKEPVAAPLHDDQPAAEQPKRQPAAKPPAR